MLAHPLQQFLAQARLHLENHGARRQVELLQLFVLFGIIGDGGGSEDSTSFGRLRRLLARLRRLAGLRLSWLALAWLAAAKNVKADTPVRNYRLTPRFGDMNFLRLAGSLAAVCYAMAKQAVQVVRVHDVEETRDAVTSRLTCLPDADPSRGVSSVDMLDARPGRVGKVGAAGWRIR